MAKKHSVRIWGLCTFLVLFLSTSTVISTTIENGSLLTINEVSYYSGSYAVSRILTSVDFDSSLKDLLPLTVIRTDKAVLNTENLQEIISNYSASDDVFQVGFLESESIVLNIRTLD